MARSRQRRNTHAADFAGVHHWRLAEHTVIVTREIWATNRAAHRQQAARRHRSAQQAVGEICYWQSAVISCRDALFTGLFEVVAEQLAGVAHHVGA